MMKQIKLAGLALIAMSAMSVASCGGNDNDPDVIPPKQDDVETETSLRLTKVEDKTNSHYDGNYSCDYSYDNKGRCIAIGTKYSSYTFDWDKGEILDKGNTNDYLWTFKTDSKNLITEYLGDWVDRDASERKQKGEKTVFSYDKSGHLTTVIFNFPASGLPRYDEFGEFKEYMKAVLTWKDGNLVHINIVWDYTIDSTRTVTEYNYEITYDSGKGNVHKQWCQGILRLFEFELIQALGNIGMYGTGTVDFPVNIKVDKKKDNQNTTYNYPVKISTNKDGYIESEIVNDRTYNYLYEEVGMRSLAF